jgi:hypothetical protein
MLVSLGHEEDGTASWYKEPSRESKRERERENEKERKKVSQRVSLQHTTNAIFFSGKTYL